MGFFSFLTLLGGVTKQIKLLKMKKQLIFFLANLLLLSISTEVDGQRQFGFGFKTAYPQPGTVRGIGIVDIEGSPYYSGWTSGSATDKDGKIYEGKGIRYNTWKDVIEVNRKGKVLILDNSVFVEFELLFVEGDSSSVTHKFFSSGFSIPKYSAEDYFEVLFDGDYKFLKKTKTEFLRHVVSPYGGRGVKKYLTDQRYFIIDKSGHPHDMTIHEKSFLKALGTDREAAAKYIQFSEIKIKSEVDVINVLKHLQLGV